MATDNQNGVALVERGYHEPTRCLAFRVRFPHYGQGADCALEALRVIGAYNAFDGDAVAEAVASFVRADNVLDYGGIEVGREMSPVLYLHVRDDVVPEFRSTIEAALRAVHVDELEWTGDTLRAWWD